MAATDGQHKASVVIDGKVTAGADIDKLTKRIDELEKRLAKAAATTDKQSEALDIAQERARNAVDRFKGFDAAVKSANEASARSAAAFGKGSAAAMAFGSAIKQVETGQASLKQGIMTVAAAFGPLGIAIGVAGSALVGFVQHELEAAEAAEEAARAIAKQRRELIASREAEARAVREDHYHQRVNAEYESDKVREHNEYLQSVKEEKEILEETIAIEEGRGGKISALLTRQAEMRAELLEREAALTRARADSNDEEGVRQAHAQAEQLQQQAINTLREDKLRLLREEGEAEKKITEEKKKQHELQGRDLDANRKIRAAFGSPNFRSLESWGEEQMYGVGLAQARAGVPVARRVDPNEVAANSASDLEGTLQTLEQQAARKEITEPERIEAATQAQLAHLATLESLQAGEQYLDQQRQVQHDAQMARIEAEQKAHEERDAKIEKGAKIATQAASIVVTSLVSTNDARREAIRQARLQGKTESEAAKAGEIAALEQQAANLMSIRNVLIGIAVEEGVRALASAARYDFVGAGLHAAAAAAATIGAATVAARARSKTAEADSLTMQGGGGFASGGSFGASASGGGGGTSSRQGQLPPGSDSAIPGSPNPQAPSAASTPWRGGNVVNFNGPIHSYGIPERDFINRVTEGQRDAAYERQPRRSA